MNTNDAIRTVLDACETHGVQLKNIRVMPDAQTIDLRFGVQFSFVYAEWLPTFDRSAALDEVYEAVSDWIQQMQVRDAQVKVDHDRLKREATVVDFEGDDD